MAFLLNAKVRDGILIKSNGQIIFFLNAKVRKKDHIEQDEVEGIEH